MSEKAIHITTASAIITVGVALVNAVDSYVFYIGIGLCCVGIIWLTLYGTNKLPDRVARAFSKNWVDVYKRKNGKYPPLPQYFAGFFKDPNKPGRNKDAVVGSEISQKLHPCHLSMQGWNRLKHSQQEQYRGLVIWLGKDPDDYIPPEPKNPIKFPSPKWGPPKQR